MNDFLPMIGTVTVFAIFVVIELRAPRNKNLKKLERQILDAKK